MIDMKNMVFKVFVFEAFGVGRQGHAVLVLI